MAELDASEGTPAAFGRSNVAAVVGYSKVVVTKMTEVKWPIDATINNGGSRVDKFFGGYSSAKTAW